MQFVDFSVRPNRIKHRNKKTIIELFIDERVRHNFFLLIAKKRRHSL